MNLPTTSQNRTRRVITYMEDHQDRRLVLPAEGNSNNAATVSNGATAINSIGRRRREDHADAISSTTILGAATGQQQMNAGRRERTNVSNRNNQSQETLEEDLLRLIQSVLDEEL